MTMIPDWATDMIQGRIAAMTAENEALRVENTSLKLRLASAEEALRLATEDGIPAW